MVLALCTSAAYSAFATGPDIIIHDCPLDNGAEPTSANDCPCIWASPDIKVQPSRPYSASVPHGAESGHMNYVYVTLENIGSGTLTSGEVHVYWAKFAVNQVWSSGWIDHHDSQGRLIGDEIGSCTISNLAPNTSTTVEIPWAAANVPNPSTFGEQSTHVCLVARFVSDEDPMTFLEGENMLENTRNNNNIAWRNTDISTPSHSTLYIIVGNPLDIPKTYSLHFSELSPTSGSTFEDFQGSMVADLGALHDVWVNNGSQGSNVSEHSSDAGNTRVDITSSLSRLDNLQLAPHEEYTITLEVNVGNTTGLNGRTFDWEVAQYEEGAEEPFGGVSMNIDWNEGSGKTALPSNAGAGSEYHIAASPNPTNGTTTISYSLPSDAKVTLAIYDAGGKLTRMLVDASELKRGDHTMIWDGTGPSGAKVPAGTYFYRLQSNDKSVQGQIKIVR